MDGDGCMRYPTHRTCRPLQEVDDEVDDEVSSDEEEGDYEGEDVGRAPRCPLHHHPTGLGASAACWTCSALINVPFDAPADGEARSKQSRSEKKARKAINKHGMKPVPGIVRVQIRKSKNVSRGWSVVVRRCPV